MPRKGMIQMTDDWLKAMDNSLVVGAIFLDFSAAFDVLDHSLLIEKLKYYGFKQSDLKWFESYLSFRTQRVYLNGTLSSSIGLECGVPQGSGLGPVFEVKLIAYSPIGIIVVMNA